MCGGLINYKMLKYLRISFLLGIRFFSLPSPILMENLMSNTIGSQILELSQRKMEKMSVVDAWKLKEPEYFKNLIECAEIHRKTIHGDFYILVNCKLEKIFSMAMPTFKDCFEAKQTCPTPNYDQALYKYNSITEEISYIWSIPDRETCHYLYYNKELVDPSERQLLDFVLKFSDGSLFKLMKQLNGEKYDSPELEK